jgi:isopentenyl-diphosphate Delta-isomerase
MSGDGAIDISQRKQDHIDLCATGDVGFKQKTTLLAEVEFIHDAVPELHLDEIDTRVTVLGKTLSLPIVIAAMTGGTEKARSINLELARIADEEGLGFGLGSQRAMIDERAGRDATYAVREVAPKALVLGNIGGVQAALMTTAELEDLSGRVGADALCVHLNPAMEIVQPGGDRDFRGVLDTIGRLVDELSIPVIAKETGCGIGLQAALKIAGVGARHLDVSGAGGTSWVAVEMQRAVGDAKHLGTLLRDWGVPTAASVLAARAAKPRFKTVIATGGVQNGIDAARAIALGADAAGIARPFLQAFMDGGRDGAKAFLSRIRQELVSIMLLTGSPTIKDLRKAPVMLGPELTKYAAFWQSKRR